MFSVAFMASFFLVVTGLLAVGLVSWSRTRDLRHGATPQAGDPPTTTSFSTCRATFLATLSGIAAIAWGVSASPGHEMRAVPLVAAGAFIAIAGWVARVTGVRADDDGLVVRFARRPPFHVQWSELGELRPPTSALGGWRLTEIGGARSTVMPSDLFGHEELLEAIVAGAGLRFDGRIWRKDAEETPGKGPMAPGISFGRRRACPSWSDGRRSGRSTSPGAAR